MRTMVVYFSRTGNTQILAQQIASACSADLEGLREAQHHAGAVSYLLSLWQGALHGEADIAPTQLSPADYDLVIVGTPIWAWNMSSPVRTYIRKHREEIRKLALFCTCDGAGQAKVLADMQSLCGQSPVATLALTARELRDHLHPERLDKFLAQLKEVGRTESPTPLRPRPAF